MSSPDEPGMARGEQDAVDLESEAAERDSSIEDVPGAPTWPIASADSESSGPTPPVGLNWAAVADRLGVDRRILTHDGIIVVAGEYFPEKGFFLDPKTMKARHVHAGDMALVHGYFLGEVTVGQFGVVLPAEARSEMSGRVVIPHGTGPVIGLFGNPANAERAREKILRNSLGTDLGVEDGPLGSQLRVGKPQLPGRVATVMASFDGAIISIAGESTTP